MTALLCAATLCLKLLVPTGYMIASDHGRIAITMCSGTGPIMTMGDLAGMHGGMDDHDKSKGRSKADMPCAFSGLSAAVTAAIDPALLVDLIAFVMAIALIGVALPRPVHAPYLRPPLRGPPLPL